MLREQVLLINVLFFLKRFIFQKLNVLFSTNKSFNFPKINLLIFHK